MEHLQESNMAVQTLPMASQYDAKATDPPLLERNSKVKSYTTSRATYPGLRVFYRRHPQEDGLPKDPAPIPLLVFIHGLGGSVAQFNSLLTSLTSIASCLAVDLPGCGVSEFTPREWDAYSTDALVELLETVIEDHRKKDEGQRVVLIGHSMGASLAALLACPRSGPQTELSKHVVGLVGICPSAGPPTEKQTKLFRKLLWIPGFIFDLWRAWDRRGGTESASVSRFVGADADAESKRLQNLYNSQSKTPVWRRMAWGALPEYRNGLPQGGIPTGDVWAQLDAPVFLVGGVGDNVCPPQEVEKIVAYIEGDKAVSGSDPDEAEPMNDSAAPVDIGALDLAREPASPSFAVAASSSVTPVSADSPADAGEHDLTEQKKSVSEDPTTPDEQAPTVPPLPLRPAKTVQSVILPKPATHALLYTPATAPVLAGLVSDFLADKVTGRLALGWQLQYLCRDGKWDVKNLAKWKSVPPVSAPIGAVFRAIKTLREVDEEHSPRQFVRQWGDTVRDVIDISHDNPVYDPRGLEAGGIRYHKFPTVSKVPPTDEEIRGFIALVDQIREDQKKRGEAEDAVIGVHCHYGFNRTGFFIVCYLVERCSLSAQEAVELFARARPNGIKHAHFKDRLYVRYSGVKSGDAK